MIEAKTGMGIETLARAKFRLVEAFVSMIAKHRSIRERHSFWLQTPSDKFYPDIVALLNDGRVIVVEYKGAHIATVDDAKEKRLVGELWAERSGGDERYFLKIKHFRRIATRNEQTPRAFRSIPSLVNAFMWTK